MKVRCINSGEWILVGRRFLFIPLWNKKTKGPNFGDIVTVVGKDYWEGNMFYDLLEWPHKIGEGYLASEFVPVEEQYEKVKLEEIKELASVN